MTVFPDDFCANARIVVSGSVFHCHDAPINAARVAELLSAAGASEVLINPVPSLVRITQDILIFDLLRQKRSAVQAAIRVSMPLVSWQNVFRHVEAYTHLRDLARHHRVGAAPVEPATPSSPLPPLSRRPAPISSVIDLPSVQDCPYALRF